MITEFLAGVGAVAIICGLSVLVIALILKLSELKDTIKYKYRYKHRFDKLPTAKCYCIDCIYWDDKGHWCNYFKGRTTADCWFCWNAEPLSRKDSEERDRRRENDGLRNH